MKESTLDYIFATKQIENLKTEQVNEASDHQILIREIETEMVKKRKLYKISKTKRIPNKENLEKSINSEWPLEIDKELGKRAKIEQLIRPKLYTKKNICYKINNSQDWEEIRKLITDSNKEEYIKRLTELNEEISINLKNFYSKLNQILRYRKKGVIVKQIKEDNIELPIKESMKKLTEYYQKLFTKNRTYQTL